MLDTVNVWAKLFWWDLFNDWYSGRVIRNSAGVRPTFLYLHQAWLLLASKRRSPGRNRYENEQDVSFCLARSLAEKIAMTGILEAGPIADLFETMLRDEIVKHQQKGENAKGYCWYGAGGSNLRCLLDTAATKLYVATWWPSLRKRVTTKTRMLCKRVRSRSQTRRNKFLYQARVDEVN